MEIDAPKINKKDNQYIQYQKIYEHYLTELGSCVAILMHSGTVYNIFDVEVNNKPTNNSAVLANILGLDYKVHRTTPLSETNPLKAGFPIYVLDKYCNKLLSANYSIVIIEERESNTKPKQRYVDRILTPGVSTNIFSHKANNVVSLFIENQKPRERLMRLDKLSLIYGISSLDVSTNESFIFECATSQNQNEDAMEEIFRFLHSMRCREISINLINFNFNNVDIEVEKKRITKYFTNVLELNKYFVHTFTINEIDSNWTTACYQNNALKATFKNKITNVGTTALEYLGIEYTSTAATSYIILLEYIRVRNPLLLSNLKIPQNWQSDEFLILTHNALEQLNLISSNKKDASLYNIINNTTTPMGKRLLEHTLVRPFQNEKILKEMYDQTENLVISGFEIINTITKSLRGIVDIRRYHRKMDLEQLSPFELNKLISSYDDIINLMKTIKNSTQLPTLSDEIITQFTSYCGNFDCIFNEDILCTEKSSKSITRNIFQLGVVTEIDEIIDQVEEIRGGVEQIATNLAHIIDPYVKEEKIFKLVKIIKPNKGGCYLEVSNKIRGMIEFYTSCINNSDDINRIIKHKSIDDLCKLNSKNIRDPHLKKYCESLLRKNKTAAADPVGFLTSNEIKLIQSLSFTPLKSKAKCFTPQITKIEASGEEIINRFHNLITGYFNSIVSKLYNINNDMLSDITEWVAKIDLLKSNATTAIKNRYNKPTIVENDHSFIEATAVRHPIIEQIQDDIIYIPNNVYIGKERSNGVLIYGVNNGGKSSYLKSVGLNVILAQAGMFVAAEDFKFKPFKNIITRLSGMDNMQRGQGSYAVEMSELCTVMNQSGPDTLVLGDEICRGTEHKSALNIVGASIVRLCQKRVNFIFSTHLRSIPDIEKVDILTKGNLPSLKYCYFTTILDRKTDEVIFEYKLRDGLGKSLYGIEIAEMMGLDQETCKLAYEFRNIMENPKTHGIPLGGKTKTRYNTKVMKGICEIENCEEPAIDSHHIEPQKSADKNGYIKHFHKNRAFNFSNLCKKHHLEQDDFSSENKITGKVQTANGAKLRFTNEYKYNGNPTNYDPKNDYDFVQKDNYCYSPEDLPKNDIVICFYDQKLNKHTVNDFIKK